MNTVQIRLVCYWNSVPKHAIMEAMVATFNSALRDKMLILNDLLQKSWIID